MSLVDMVCGNIRESIESGERGPGARLPSEAEIGGSLGVSRTVVREAISRLAAEGLVIPRHGTGVFVSETAKYQAFQVTRDEVESLDDVIQLLELRLAVETEMASLAAERRTDEDIAEMRRWLANHASAQAGMDDSVNADAEFHRVIAKASQNPYYLKFIDFLGVRLVPPRSIFLQNSASLNQDEYIARISDEHEAVVSAIERGDARQARVAAHKHMSESLKRHRALRDEAKS